MWRGREAISSGKWPRKIPVANNAETPLTYTCLHSLAVNLVFVFLTPPNLTRKAPRLAANISACGQKYLNVPLL